MESTQRGAEVSIKPQGEKHSIRNDPLEFLFNSLRVQYRSLASPHLNMKTYTGRQNHPSTLVIMYPLCPL
jgi:hypothetical protein